VALFLAVLAFSGRVQLLRGALVLVAFGSLVFAPMGMSNWA